MKSLPSRPIIGQTIATVHGPARVVSVPCYGSAIVETVDGKHYNISGLGWKVEKKP